MFETGEHYSIKTIENGAECSVAAEVIEVKGHLLKVRRYDDQIEIFNTAASSFVGATPIDNSRPVTIDQWLDAS